MESRKLKVQRKNGLIVSVTKNYYSPKETAVSTNTTYSFVAIVQSSKWSRPYHWLITALITPLTLLFRQLFDYSLHKTCASISAFIFTAPVVFRGIWSDFVRFHSNKPSDFFSQWSIGPQVHPAMVWNASLALLIRLLTPSCVPPSLLSMLPR